GLDLDASAASFSYHLAIGMTNYDGTSASMKSELTTDRPHIDGAASGVGVYSAANVIQFQTAAAALRFYPARESHGLNISTFGFQLDQRHFTWHFHRKLRGAMARPFSTLPIADNPGGIALHVRGYLVLFELAARILF